MLLAAGIKRARGLIVTTSSDATNLYVILSARLLNADLLIASRAVDDASVPKLLRAGANRAISPYAIGGRRLAHVMLSPRVVDFLETALTSGNKALNIDDVVVGQGGKTIESLQVSARSGATVLAVVRDGQPTASPRGDFQLAAGSIVFDVATLESVQENSPWAAEHGRLRLLVPFSVEKPPIPVGVSVMRTWSNPFGPLGTPLLDRDDPSKVQGG
jgi:voltage-gated potassium channel